MAHKISKPILLAVLLASLSFGGIAQAQLPAILAPPMPDFTLETGHPLAQVIIPRLIPILIQDVSPTLGEVTLVPRVTNALLTGMVDALAPYHPTAVGVFTRIERRPQEEWTLHNMNEASLYAAYHSLRGMLPHREAVWVTFLTDFGLDPMVDGMDKTTAAGTGAVAARLHDGMNQMGNYANTTGYAPVNTAYELVDASRWQPAFNREGMGVHTVQTFVTPQMANVEPWADFDPRDYRHSTPTASNPENWDEYVAQVDEVLAASANLTDEQKMAAELFDNKIVALGFSFIHAAVQNQISPMDFARGDWLAMGALQDAMIVTWQEKARHDAVRPFSAIAHVYGDELVTAWGGPGMGTTEIPASQWQSYIPASDHPEFPSASTCACAASGQAARHFFGADELGWSVTFPAGSSRIEPGITPAEDLTLSFATWSDLEDDCGKSGVWAGVHFSAAIEASAAMCYQFGDMMWDYFSSVMDGTAPERAAAQPLDPDPRMHDLDN